MRLKSIEKKIKNIDRRIMHRSKMLDRLQLQEDIDKCHSDIAKLTRYKIELVDLLRQEKQDRRSRLLNGLSCTVGTVALITVIFAIFLYGSDKEAEIQRNKVAAHRIEQAYK